MKKMLLLFSVLAAMIDCNAQFNHLQTQYLLNPFVLNPACAGEQGYMSATVSYRRQWCGLEGAPETFLFTMDSPIHSRHHNIGIIAGQDNVAVMHRTMLRLAYAYRIMGQHAFLSAGISPGITWNNYNWNSVVTNAPDDAFATDQQSVSHVIGFGLYFNCRHAFAGFSGQFSDDNQNSISVDDQPFELYSGLRFGKKENVAWTVSVLGRYMSPHFYQFDYTAFAMIHDRVGFGLAYRMNESIAAMVQVKLNDQFRIGYSYDYTLSHLNQYSTGSHEIVLRYDFGYTVNDNLPR